MSETGVGLSELPDGWAWTTLGEIIEPSKEKVNPLAIEETPYISLEHIEKGTGKLLGHGRSSDVRSSKTKFNRGDLLYGKLRPYLNKVYISDFEGICSTDLLVFPKNELLSNTFFLYRFLCRDFVNYASYNVSGVNLPRVNFQTLSRFKIPLPPLSEQHRIVTKIEELFTKLDTGINELHKAQSQLKRYRQSVLKAAFEGKLTEAWRAEHQDKIKPVAPIAGDLPDGWTWTTLEDVSELNPRIDKKSIDDDLEVTFLPMKNVEELSGKIDLSETKRFSELKRKNYTPFQDGDILFAKVTPCMENGKIAIAHDLKNGIGFGSTEFHVIRLSEEQSKQFFFFYFLQQKFRQEAKRAMTSGVGLLRVPTDYMRKVPIPLPPLLEQQAIVSEVESRLSVADKVEKTVTAELKRAEQLRQSILKKAFSGELVPQDPNDEPASILLERIKAGKSKGAQGQLRLKLV